MDGNETLERLVIRRHNGEVYYVVPHKGGLNVYQQVGPTLAEGLTNVSQRFRSGAVFYNLAKSSTNLGEREHDAEELNRQILLADQKARLLDQGSEDISTYAGRSGRNGRKIKSNQRSTSE